MAQPATNPKIEELRFRLKADPKSRLFFPLAEELRKAGQLGEAEQVLLNGLSIHATYLSAWVSLGRVLHEQKNDTAAVEALSKALQLDPGNVVAARLLADSYLALGEKLEAIKKYKLVHALLPADEELNAIITQLDRDLHPPQVAAPEPLDEAGPLAEPDPFDEAEPLAASAPAPEPEPKPEAAPLPLATYREASAFAEPSPFSTPDDSPFAAAAASLMEEERVETATADVEPMSAAHATSPFEEPVETYTAAALEIEAPPGYHVDPAPLVADVPTPVDELLPEESDIFAPAAPPAEVPPPDIAETLTMADIYVRQGLLDDARNIYEHILARDPGNAAVRERLAALNPPPPDPKAAKIARLEGWLARVARKEVGRV